MIESSVYGEIIFSSSAVKALFIVFCWEESPAMM